MGVVKGDKIYFLYFRRGRFIFVVFGFRLNKSKIIRSSEFLFFF